MLPIFGGLVRIIIEMRGRRFSAPDINFEENQVIQDGGYSQVGAFWYWLTGTSGFYLSLPANTWGVVTNPDGSQNCPPGGVYLVPPGSYKVQYIDQHERHEYTEPVSEVTTDGENLTLSVLIHYRVANPRVACQIDRPVETLMANIETDLAQYIRTHAHDEIAEGADARDRGRIRQFFFERHLGRNLLSRAFIINSVEIKDFTGDAEYFNMRRSRALQQHRDEIEAEELERQREIERINAEHALELNRLKTEAHAEIAKILDDTKKREIELGRLRMKDERQYNLLVDLLAAMKEVIEHAAYARGADAKVIVEQLRETIMSVLPLITEEKVDERDKARRDLPPLTPAEQKIKNLTDTLRNLLK
jgi:hypothetical protein